MQFHPLGEYQTTLNLYGKPLNPLPFKLSTNRLRLFVPEMTGFSAFLHQLFVRLGKQFDDLSLIKVALSSGETAPAIVMSVAPLRVAVRATALDCVVILDFPTSLCATYGLRVGSRLLAVNNYSGPSQLDRDLMPGPRGNPLWTSFIPQIVDFICDEVGPMQGYKAAISEAEWQALFRVAQQVIINSMGGQYRDGRPHLSKEALAESQKYEANFHSAQRARKILLSVLAAIILVPSLSCAGIMTLVRSDNNRRAIATAPSNVPTNVRPPLPDNAAAKASPTASSPTPSVEAPPKKVSKKKAAKSDAPPPETVPPPPPPHEEPPPAFYAEARKQQEEVRKKIEAEFDRQANGSRPRSFESPLPLEKGDGTPITEETMLKRGDKVIASWGGRWWKATVESVNAADVTISYEGWSGTETVSRRNLRLPSK